VLGWRYYEFGFRSQTRVQELLYRWDETRRLRDAQFAKLPPVGEQEYVEPGVLWWTFDAMSASRRGAPSGVETTPVPDPTSPGVSRDSAAVLVLDEVDRVDPSVCRDLVDVLVAASFQVPELGLRVVPLEPPLVILTSGDERALPPAVTRACVGVVLALPDMDALIEIGRLHFPDVPVEKLAAVAERVVEGAPVPTTGQFLDVLRVLQSLGVEPGDDRFKVVEKTILGAGRAEIEQPMAPVTKTSAAEGCVFVCYSRDDESFVLPLAKALLQKRMPRVWLDQWSIPGGADWNAAIDEAILSCARFLIVLSPSAVASPEVQSELRLALNENRPVIPVVLEPCRIPRQLTILQHIHVAGRAPDDASMLEQIVRALARE
jgi:hypothetical protein